MNSYTINGNTYTQKKLVLGQISQLTALMKGLVFSGTDAMAIIGALGDKLPEAIAIVLRKEGEALADKDMTSVLRDVNEIDIPEAVQIVADFFDCNPIHSLLESVNGIVAAIQRSTSGLMKSSAPSQPETSQSTTQSSGE
jgi:hypothetical protein